MGQGLVRVWKPGVSGRYYLRLYCRVDWKTVLVFFDADASSREGGIGLVLAWYGYILGVELFGKWMAKFEWDC